MNELLLVILAIVLIFSFMSFMSYRDKRKQRELSDKLNNSVVNLNRGKNDRT